MLQYTTDISAVPCPSSPDNGASSFESNWSAQYSWDSSVADSIQQYQTPLTPDSSSMSRSPSAQDAFGHSAQNGVNRSFPGYKLDPYEPRTYQATQRLAHSFDSSTALDLIGGNGTHYSLQSHHDSAPQHTSNSLTTAKLRSPFLGHATQAPSASTTTGSSVASQTDSSNGQIPKPLRKNKQHVQAACFHCKKAHLSCDAARPCGRCVGSGKQDTCHDVPHKKRGRPRLRDKPNAYARTRNMQQTGYNLAGLQHQQYDLYGRYNPQVLRSQSGHVNPNAWLTRQGALAGHHLSPFVNLGANRPINPVAFLNMDLTFVKANHMFQRLFGSIDFLRMRKLESIVSYENNIQAVRMQGIGLREEKDSRNVSSLPPPNSFNDHESIPDVEQVDYRSLTQSFENRTQELWFNYASGQMQQLAVSLRLAKMSTYFVVLVLPPFIDPPVVNVPMYSHIGAPNAAAAAAAAAASSSSAVAPSYGTPYGAPNLNSAYANFSAGQLSSIAMDSAQARNSPPQSAAQSPLYTYQSMEPLASPNVQATPRAFYDGSSYVTSANSGLQGGYQASLGYGPSFGGISFGQLGDTRTGQQYFLNDGNQQASMQLPPLASQQQHHSHRMMAVPGSEGMC